MSQAATLALRQAPPLHVNIQALNLTDEQFLRLCRDNRDLRFELTAQRELVILSPATSETG